MRRRVILKISLRRIPSNSLARLHDNPEPAEKIGSPRYGPHTGGFAGENESTRRLITPGNDNPVSFVRFFADAIIVRADQQARMLPAAPQ